MTAVAWSGPEFIDHGWAPAPRYLLRRARILRQFKNMTPGSLVEVGCASGALLSELTKEGFDCTGVESSSAALALARRVHADAPIKFCEMPASDWREKFDYCAAFEVLEHIEDDEAALREWASWLRPGGAMLLSVPANPRYWNASDVWAGHFRRYRGRDLQDLFEKAGMRIEYSECFGFPLGNFAEFLFAQKCRQSGLSAAGQSSTNKAEQTAQSGIDRATQIRLYKYYAQFPGSLIMRALIWAQSLFLKFGVGNGILVVARKP